MDYLLLKLINKIYRKRKSKKELEVKYDNVVISRAGVAVGSGWQSYVAYINLGCYYLIGVPLGFIMGWVFHQGVMVRTLFSFFFSFFSLKYFELVEIL